MPVWLVGKWNLSANIINLKNSVWNISRRRGEWICCKGWTSLYWALCSSWDILILVTPRTEGERGQWAYLPPNNPFVRLQGAGFVTIRGMKWGTHTPLPFIHKILEVQSPGFLTMAFLTPPVFTGTGLHENCIRSLKDQSIWHTLMKNAKCCSFKDHLKDPKRGNSGSNTIVVKWKAPKIRDCLWEFQLHCKLFLESMSRLASGH